MARTSGVALPAGWSLERKETTYDGHMEREFTRIAYTAGDGRTVRITDVQEPNSFGGWGYLVWSDGRGREELGLVETLTEAREIAESYMRAQQGETR